MTTLQIRDLDEATYQALVRRARRQRRSLARQAAVLLEEALLAPAGNRSRRGDLLATLSDSESIRWPEDLPPPEALIAEDRAR